MELLQLHRYQKEGADWLARKKFCLLGDEMGIGKTAQAIHAFDLIKAQRLLIVCPAIARAQWVDEFKKFSPIVRDFKIIYKLNEPWPKDKSIVTTYECATAAKDPGRFDATVLDEAHFLKTPTTDRTKAILGSDGLLHKSPRTWCLTGTPMPNHPGELWLFLFLCGATKLKYMQFVEYYCDTRQDAYGLKIEGAKEEKIPEFQKLLERHMKRRTKDEIGFQLPNLYSNYYLIEPGEVDLEEHHGLIRYAVTKDIGRKVLYDVLDKERKVLETILDNTNAMSKKETILEAVSNSVSTLRYWTGLQKINPMAEIITDELEKGAYKKVVLFCYHRDVMNGLFKRLQPFNPLMLIGGKTSQHGTHMNIKKFQENPKYQVMIASIRAAGTAINLTAASQLVFVEQDWVPGNNAQAAMRCHRLGQKETVFVRIFSINDSIDSRVNQVLKRKSFDLMKIYDDKRLTSIKDGDIVFTETKPTDSQESLNEKLKELFE